MADYFTQFSCVLDVGTADKALAALDRRDLIGALNALTLAASAEAADGKDYQ